MNDVIYKRNITAQLLLLRVIPVLVIVFLIILIIRGVYDYALFISILLSPAFFLSPTQLILNSGNIEIKKYFLLTLITKTFYLKKECLVSIKRHDEEIEEIDEEIFMTITSTVIIFTFKDDKGKEQSVKVKLNVKEYMMLLGNVHLSV
jgi:hypothetical protein